MYGIFHAGKHLLSTMPMRRASDYDMKDASSSARQKRKHPQLLKSPPPTESNSQPMCLAVRGNIRYAKKKTFHSFPLSVFIMDIPLEPIFTKHSLL